MQIFLRSVVFVLDRSGSMTGDPMQYAKQAIFAGLETLQAYDDFTIIAFDHEQVGPSKVPPGCGMSRLGRGTGWQEF